MSSKKSKRERRTAPDRSGDRASRVARPESPAPKGLPLIRLLLLAAVAVSSYLAWTAYQGGTVAGCAAGESCDVVLKSKWSQLAGLPVSVPALVIYLLLLAATFRVGDASAARRRTAWGVLLIGAFAIIGAALWFTGLQVAVIGAYCGFCLTTHALGVVAAILILKVVPKRMDGGTESAVAMWKAKLAGAGIAGVLVLALVQVLVTPDTTVIAQGGASAIEETPAAASPADAADQPAAAPQRTLSIHDGKFRFDLAKVPLIGGARAPHVMVGLFDYTCSHCAHEYHLVRDYIDRHDGGLAFIALPMPLDAACNPMLTSTAPAHANACVYAKLGMGVWLAAPERFTEYQDWFFSTQKIPSMADALAKADEMAGKEELDRALQDPWIEEWLKTGRDLFTEHARITGQRSLPQLVMGSAVMVGTSEVEGRMDQLLNTHFGLPLTDAANGGASPDRPATSAP